MGGTREDFRTSHCEMINRKKAAKARVEYSRNSVSWFRYVMREQNRGFLTDKIRSLGQKLLRKSPTHHCFL